MPKRPRFSRSSGSRSYRKLFLVATEGDKTEPQYFGCFRHDARWHLKILPTRKKSAPHHVLKRMENALEKISLGPTDEAWIVVDTDNWENDQLLALVGWSNRDPRHHLAVSNPQFEYWLLLHFEEGHGVASARECLTRLENALVTFHKGQIQCEKFLPLVPLAIQRAAAKDQPPCEDFPRRTGSTVYRLVEKLVPV